MHLIFETGADITDAGIDAIAKSANCPLGVLFIM